jgi:lycopene beta-cyclase
LPRQQIFSRQSGLSTDRRAGHVFSKAQVLSRLVIAGGGLAGCLCALALARRRPDVELLLVEQGVAFGGNHIWSFFDSDVVEQDRWVVGDIAATHWLDHEVRFPRRQRTIPIGYNSIRSSALDAAMRKVLKPEQYKLGREIASVSPTSIILDGGDRIDADAVIDARGAGVINGLGLGRQKFVGRVYRYPAPHGVTRPVIMDATVEQIDGYRFVYQLPLSEIELLIEDTYYSMSPVIDEDALRGRIARVAAKIGKGAEVVSEERGLLPVVLSGEADCFWRGEPIARIGTRGGFFHPTTSYSLPDAVANAALLAEQRDLNAPALHTLFRRRAEKLWQERSFFRLLGRMLFHAAEPDQAYRVLEHFYRLSPAVISRFYGARLSATDKLRILSGRPPVPLGRAISAMLRSAA